MNEQMCWVMDLEKTKELSCQASYMIEEELKVVGVDSYASYWNAVRTIINTFE
jgi:hypothetical protein